MKIPTFGEVVVVSDGDVIYVFPTNYPHVTFMWHKYLSEKDWGFWYMYTAEDGRAYKVVLHPHGPSASIGDVEESWGRVLKRTPVKIPPRVFFILSYASSSFDPEYLKEPKIVSIKDFDRERVRALATRLKSQLIDLIIEDAWGYDWEEWEEEYEESGEEDPCLDFDDPDECEE